MTPWNDRATDQDFIPEREPVPPVTVRQVIYTGPVGILPEVDAQLVRRTQ